MLVDPAGLMLVCLFFGGIGFALGWCGGTVDAIQKRREFDETLQAKALRDPPEVIAAEFDRMVSRAASKPCPHCDAPPGHAHSSSCPAGSQGRGGKETNRGR